MPNLHPPFHSQPQIFATCILRALPHVPNRIFDPGWLLKPIREPHLPSSDLNHAAVTMDAELSRKVGNPRFLCTRWTVKIRVSGHP